MPMVDSFLTEKIKCLNVSVQLVQDSSSGTDGEYTYKHMKGRLEETCPNSYSHIRVARYMQVDLGIRPDKHKANRKGLCSLQSRIEIPLAAHFGNERNFSLFSSNLNLLKLFNDREMAKTLVSRHASRAPVTPSVMKLVGIARHTAYIIYIHFLVVIQQHFPI